MSQTVDQIVNEEQAAIQAEVNQRVVVRLQGALQSVKDKVANLQSEETDLQAEIEAREPKAEEAAETPDQESQENLG
jgi:hypothetical protein